MVVAGRQWERLDVPLLEKVAELEGDVGVAVENHVVLATAMGDEWSEAMVLAVVRRLVEARYLTAIDAGSMADEAWLNIRLGERGRRAAGLWPAGDQVAHELLSILDERIADARDDEERGRWRQLRDCAAAVGQGVLSGVLVEAAKRGMAL